MNQSITEKNTYFTTCPRQEVCQGVRLGVDIIPALFLERRNI